MHDRRFERTRLLLGDAAMARLQAARVAVVGLGAVGSYAVEGLARAGVGHLRLVDFDRVEPTNINRQLYALESTLGQSKVDLAAGRVRDINPSCAVEPLDLFVTQDTVARALMPPLDLVVDAIDSLNAKVGLLEACVRAGVPVISIMGAARRTDPLLIRVADLDATRACPLARFVRKRLHRRGIRTGIRCVFSTEPAGHAAAVPDASDPSDLSDTADLSDTPRPAGGRPRAVLGSVSYMTGIMGLVAAREAIARLTKP